MTPAHASEQAEEVCRLAPVIPVLVIDDLATARPLAEALIAGGLPALEVTLRTPVALEAIEEMASVPGGVVGAGTLLTPADVRAAKAAGALFGVSPGATDRLLKGLRGCRTAAVARCGDCDRGNAAAGAWLHRAEVLSRRGIGRRPGAEIDRRPVAADPVLPDGRGVIGECARLPEPSEHALRRWILGRPGRASQGWRLGRDHRFGPRGGGAETVACPLARRCQAKYDRRQRLKPVQEVFDAKADFCLNLPLVRR